ncbi:MAG: RNA polymerase sigma-70 factor [Ginsengibacter sp.]
MIEPTTNTVQDLLLKVAGGDEIAFSELFKTYYNLLGDFIMRVTESEPLTQEIVQDVFLKIWINRSALAEIHCFKAYLIVVARNHALNSLKQIAREKSRKKEWVDTVLHQASYEAEEPPSIDHFRLVDEAVALLPPQQKKVYTLSRTHGMKHAEIARELNISLETVKKHMVLSLSFLKNKLRSNAWLFIIFTAECFQ